MGFRCRPLHPVGGGSLLRSGEARIVPRDHGPNEVVLAAARRGAVPRGQGVSGREQQNAHDRDDPGGGDNAPIATGSLDDVPLMLSINFRHARILSCCSATDRDKVAKRIPIRASSRSGSLDPSPGWPGCRLWEIVFAK